MPPPPLLLLPRRLLLIIWALEPAGINETLVRAGLRLRLSYTVSNDC